MASSNYLLRRATLGFLVLLATFAAPAMASANGTIKALKGGDRVSGQDGYATYAAGLAGATFEYSTSPTFAAITGTFPATGASGAATVSVPAGTYYVREQSTPAGWSNLGPQQSLFFDPGSNNPASARNYVSTVRVSDDKTTETFPNQSTGDVQLPDNTGSPFINVRNNPAFPNHCGLKIQLVLDRSGSIEPQKEDYRLAARAFIEALDDTPTQVGITSFARGANAATPGGVVEQAPLSLASAANAQTLKNKIDAVYAAPQGGTDWDDALRDASGRAGFTPTAPSPSAKPDMVVLITDGNPTASSAANSDGGTGVHLLDLTYGMASANLVKSQTVAGSVKTKLFAVGVGSGVTPANLKVVSGPNDDTHANPDYAATSIASLVNKLKEIASRTCGARIVLRKKLVGAGDDATPRPSWNFTAAASAANVSYSDPDNASPYSTSGSPAHLTAALNGIPEEGTNVSLTEDAAGQPLAAADYTLTSVTCETGAFGSGNTVSTTSIARGVSLTGVQRNTDLFCTFTNARKATVTIRKVTDPADPANTPFGFASGLPATAGPPAIAANGTFALPDGDAVTTSVVPGTYVVTENDPRSLSYKLTGLSCTETRTQNTTVSTAAALTTQRKATIAAEPGEAIVCTYTNRHVVGQVNVVKDGDSIAYHGDTASYTFSVTNTGNSPLSDVHVTDDKCPNVSPLPTSKQNDDGDALLDPAGTNGTSSEVWVFTCSYTVGAHAGGEANPVVNTAQATATDELDRPVGDEDDHETTLLHPAIDIDKTGPATATAGDSVSYSMVVTNTGDVAFPAPLVVVTDALCEAPPLLTGVGTDATPATLDPGDSWEYECAVQTVAGQTAVHNVANVDGTDVNGHHATDEDPADTTLTQPTKPAALIPGLPPATQVIAGDTDASPGKARIRGKTGCIGKTAKIVVSGSRIERVTFSVDRRHKKTDYRADSKGRFLYTVRRSWLTTGTHRIRARVVFTRNTTPMAKGLVMDINRCRRAILKPSFTG